MPYTFTCSTALLELTVLAKYGTKRVANVFGLFVDKLAAPDVWSGGSTPVLTAFRAFWNTGPCVTLANGYQVDGYVLRHVVFPFPGGAKWTFDAVDTLPPGGGGGGSAGNAALSTQATVNVLLRTARVGRSFRGRKEMSPIPESQTDNAVLGGNNLTAGAIADWTAAYNTLVARIPIVDGGDTRELVWCVSSLKQYRLGFARAGGTGNEVTSFLVQPHTGSMVRRKAKNI